ncbi:CopL family metal-binding regulatory protein [Pseudoxanthomonas indica]|uniref:CopL family metal-binding regulatory protein n=1 Tax=Pseudoxanthomonas indica TaxID=428993 RepID=A0A1T5ILS9_9GAMM|nr:CopL family metal-binding regulatory protein [Pseudoxanthomonas indica]GGD53019.1 hypothetical protein GCM10007235_26530 [Pseudoxanthomonas indica]SKC40141.1 hypothetical protein SAMN06296058_0068 [Pseudoxanthomonas indica]
MSRESLLLRLLLAVSLVITTSAGALASARMHLSQAGAAVATAPVVATQAGAPCHDEPGTLAAAATEHAASAPVAAQEQAPAQGHADCCLGGDCDGICLLSLPPLPVATALAGLPPVTARYLIEAHADRAAPRLTRPQRPPIA